MSIKKGEIIDLKIDSAAFKGKGIGRKNGKAVFVPNTAPGDHVKTRIIKRNKSYLEGRLLKVLEAGNNRITPKCQHAKACGGCSWQHVDYEAQLAFKQQQVQDHMQRIGGLDDLTVKPTLRCENIFHYRNKMEYSIGHRRWLSREEINADEFISDRGFAAGLHAPGRFDKILNLSECHLQDPISYQILDFIRQYCISHDIKPFNRNDFEGYLRNVVIRTSHHTDDLMVNLVTYKNEPDTVEGIAKALKDEFPAITTIVNNVNDRNNPTAVGRFEKVIIGSASISDSIGPYQFEISANAFFQTNTLQAERLYEIARQYADLQNDDIVYDLYCGVGTLSLFLSGHAEKIVGIELEDVAVQNAVQNAKDNEVENVHFVKGDMKDAFNDNVTDSYGAPDCLITDPPRNGMHPDVVERLKKLEVPKMVYISCNTSTMARDMKKLADVYDIQEIQPVDMFPHTYHIEAVAKLRLKS